MKAWFLALLINDNIMEYGSCTLSHRHVWRDWLLDILRVNILAVPPDPHENTPPCNGTIRSTNSTNTV